MPIINKIFCIKKDTCLTTPNEYTIWKIIGLFIVGLLFAGSMLTFYFIYLYSYLTLSNSNTIIILNSNLAIDIIDTKTFKFSEEMIKTKNELPEVPEKIRNIFYYFDLTTPFVATSTVSTTNTIKLKSINTKNTSTIKK